MIPKAAVAMQAPHPRQLDHSHLNAPVQTPGRRFVTCHGNVPGFVADSVNSLMFSPPALGADGETVGSRRESELCLS